MKIMATFYNPRCSESKSIITTVERLNVRSLNHTPIVLNSIGNFQIIKIFLFILPQMRQTNESFVDYTVHCPTL